MFLACVGPHLVSKLLLRRSAWPRRFLAWAAWIVGARVRLCGPAIQPHSLLIANHVSWIDILVLGGRTGCRFVSKDELGHPFVHWLADQNDTLYVRRSHRKGAREQALAIADALHGAAPLALFPEGTTGPGDTLLPFRSTLLEAAAYAERDVRIRPVAIDYGPAAREVGWYGESGKSNVTRLLARKGALQVTIRLLEPLPCNLDRKQLARQSAAMIEAALSTASSRRFTSL